MLKLVLVGAWVILVTAGAALSSALLTKSAGDAGKVAEDEGVEQLTTDLTSVPVIRDGDVAGYVVLQLSFAADRSLLDQKKLDPMPYIKDAAFRVIFTQTDIDFRHLRANELDQISNSIAEEANRRLGNALVRQVLFQQMNYVRKEDIRTNWIGGDGGGN